MYSSKVEQPRFIIKLDCKEYSFLVKEDVQILHGDNFGDQLAFYKMLFCLQTVVKAL